MNGAAVLHRERERSATRPHRAASHWPHRPTMVRSAAGIGQLGTVLGVWAHPDDEAYLSGGLMSLARDAGLRVVCVTATRGELGTPDPVAWPPDRLAGERSRELERSLGILGVTEHHWLGARDGACPRLDTDAVRRLGELIDEVRPQTVLSFGPDGITGHPDHQAVSAWTTAAFDRAAPAGARLLYATVPEGWPQKWAYVDEQFDVYASGYPITTRANRLAVDLRLDDDTAARKVRALRAQTTQTAGLVAALGLPVYTAWVAREAFVERSRAASHAVQVPVDRLPGDVENALVAQPGTRR